MRNSRKNKLYAVTRDSRIDPWDESTNQYTDRDVIIVKGFASRQMAESFVKRLPSHHSANHQVKITTGAALRKMGMDPNKDSNWSSILRPFSFPSNLSREQVTEVDDIALSNADEAFDQVRDYENLQEALDVYWDNAADTLLEYGYSPQDSDHSRFVDAVQWIAKANGFEARLVGTDFEPEGPRPDYGE